MSNHNRVPKESSSASNVGQVIPLNLLWPFLLLTTLFAWWGLANNMTDTLLAAFKRIMSFDDGKTAWIQVVCYALGYGCFAIPGAMFMKRFTFKAGVLLGLGMYVVGTLLFFPACLTAATPNRCYLFYLVAILITFAGLSVLETACNPYICALGSPETATRRLNFSQSFNPVGSIAGVAISQMFILSHLNPLTEADRAQMTAETLAQVRTQELHAISYTYGTIGLILLATWLLILFTRMPRLREEDKRIDFVATWRRLFRNRNYVCGVIAQFFYVGAQIATWSFAIRYCMAALNLDEVLAGGGPEAFRHLELVSAGFYAVCEAIRFNAFIPKTAEQAAATYYVISLILFVVMRFVCTGLMKYFKPSTILSVLALLAILFCLNTALRPGVSGVYTLIGITGCMSLMFPTIFAFGTRGLGEDLKMGGSGMVMAIAGAALLTQIQGLLSDKTGSIALTYLVPAAGFAVVGAYALFVTRRAEQDS
ncbi:MAG: L-fucose:H+ symporter permease [Thermoguttaceae bacterium]|nr:L-fucose:H+ symporter permease [Thermoguttaceae bacterium]